MQNVVSLSCESGAKCIRFRCLIRNIDANKTAVIQVPSRLWNATFVEEFPDVHHVSIKSFGAISLNPIFNIEQSDKDDKFWVSVFLWAFVFFFIDKICFLIRLKQKPSPTRHLLCLRPVGGGTFWASSLASSFLPPLLSCSTR